MPDASLVDLLVALAYPLLLVGPVFLSARWLRGGRDYFAGGRRIPWLISGISLFMAGFTARTFTNSAGLLFLSGWQGLFWFLGLPAAHALLAWALAGRWRRTRSLSPIEFTRDRFGAPTQRILGLLMGTACLLAASIQLLALGRVLESLLAPEVVVFCMLAGGALVLIYTLIGGLWAVALTDAFHFLILFSIALVVAALSLALLPEGSTLFRAILTGTPRPSGFHGPLLDSHLLIALGLSQLLVTATAGAPLFFSVPDEQAARKAGLLAAGLFLVSPFLFGLPALVAHSVWPAGAGPLPGNPTGSENPGAGAFLSVAWHVLPQGLRGLLLVALGAATLSSLNLLLHQASAIFCRDIWPRHQREDHETRDGLRQGRMATLAGGLLILALTLTLHTQGRWAWNGKGLLLFQALLALPLLVGLLAPTIPRRAALMSLAWGVLAGATASVILGWAQGPATFLALGTTLAVLFTSRFLRGEYRYARHILYLRTLATAGTLGSLFYFGTLYQMVHWGTPGQEFLVPWRWWATAGVSLLLGISLVPYCRSLQGERPGERDALGRFFLLLSTPVDRGREAFGEKRFTRLACGFLGVTAVALGFLVLLLASLLSLSGALNREEALIFMAVASLQILVGGVLLVAARPRPDPDLL